MRCSPDALVTAAGHDFEQALMRAHHLDAGRQNGICLRLF